MANVSLYGNSQALNLTVELNGYGRKATYFKQHEVWYDEDGWVRSFSMTYDDGTFGNFKLIPKHPTTLKVAESIASAASSIGLSIAAGKILKSHSATRSQPEYVHHVGKYLAGKVGGVMMHDLFARLSIEDSAYYEITTHELVITSPVRLKLG